jgi:NAD(P)-dependent dehydrogenase (short-subunit alcohol dehydrogenase family)
MTYSSALIVGAGSGLSASLARLFHREGLTVSLAARNIEKLKPLAEATGARLHQADATDPAAVAALFEAVAAASGDPDIVIYNAGGRTRGPVAELDPAAVAQTIAVSGFGGFLVGQAAARRQLKRGHGAIIFTGATASVKGFALSAPFAMGKFALRGLAQSMARELAPRGIHVAHVIVDGVIRSATRRDPAERPDSTLDPDAIAESYWHLLQQPRNAWSWEIEVRPWVETF